jgi:hypothetical protein
MSHAELESADPDRRAMAALRWDDTFGDRDTSLVILVYDADPAEIRQALHWALVEDDELRLLERAPELVAQWDDPFGEWHTDPCETDESTGLPVEGGAGQSKNPTGERDATGPGAGQRRRRRTQGAAPVATGGSPGPDRSRSDLTYASGFRLRLMPGRSCSGDDHSARDWKAKSRLCCAQMATDWLTMFHTSHGNFPEGSIAVG